MGWLAGIAGGVAEGAAAAGVAEGAAAGAAGLGTAEGAAGLGAGLGAAEGVSGLGAGLGAAEIEGMTGGMSGAAGLGAEASQGAAGQFFANMWNASGAQQDIDSAKNLFSGERDFSNRLGTFAGETFKNSRKGGGNDASQIKFQEAQAAEPTEGTPMIFDAESELNRLKSRMGQQ